MLISSFLFAIVLAGAGCIGSPITQEDSLATPPEETSAEQVALVTYTQTEIDALVANILPSDEWREATQWLALGNGNVWLLTRPIVTKGDPMETNPCVQTNNCPIESWIVNPTDELAHLSSSQNSYLAKVEVLAEETDNGHVRIDWIIAVGSSTITQMDRTEYVSNVDGSMQSE